MDARGVEPLSVPWGQLTPADWGEIDDKATREEDPLLGTKVTEEFAALRDNILKREVEV